MPGLVLSAFPPDSALVAKVRPSPNHGERRGYARPENLVLHYTGMPTASSAIALLCDPAREVSCHYVIEETGRILQLVPENRRAWHAGVSSWRGERDMNSASIGVEICNAGHDGGLPDFPEAQVVAMIALCRDVMSRQGIRPERVLAHSDIAPNRKRDPGERFPWARLAEAGAGLWVEPSAPSEPLAARGHEGPHVRGLQTLLALWGYEIEANGVYDAQTQVVVAAFQRRFRPERVDGVADAGLVRSVRALLDLASGESREVRSTPPG